MYEYLKQLLADAPAQGARSADAFANVHQQTVGLADSGTTYHMRHVDALHEMTVTRHEDAPMPKFHVPDGPGKQRINPLQNATLQEVPDGHYRNIDLSTREVRLVPVGAAQ